MDITVTLTTRNRYYTTLPLCLMSIFNQTLSPKRIILVDDNKDKIFYNIPQFKDILFLFKQKNIGFSYFHGESKGQVFAQQIALENTNTELIFKMDDDNILENNVLELLYNYMKDDVGMVSCLILTKDDLERKLEYEDKIYNKIEDIYDKYNIQFIKNQDNEIKQVEHLHGSYLFKRELVDSYPLEFSPSGHREDTVTSYEIYRKGHKLLVVPQTIIWHLKEKTGGNRLFSYEKEKENELKFIDKLKEWKIVPDKIQMFEDNKMVYTSKNNIKYLIYEKR